VKCELTDGGEKLTDVGDSDLKEVLEKLRTLDKSTEFILEDMKENSEEKLTSIEEKGIRVE